MAHAHVGHAWFGGGVSQEEAEGLLAGQPAGTFLVREGKAGALVMQARARAETNATARARLRTATTSQSRFNQNARALRRQRTPGSIRRRCHAPPCAPTHIPAPPTAHRKPRPPNSARL